MGLITTHWSRLELCYKFLCSIFSKGTKPFDFIKCTVIWKLTYNIKCSSQINGCLILFFGNSRISFQNFGLIVDNVERINTRKRNTVKIVQYSSVKICFILFKCYRSIDNRNYFCHFSCCEKAHDNKEFRRENSKHHPESRITTR